MAARKSTRVNRKYKTKYRVTNWREYERGLRRRGNITVWFSDEAREAWTPPKNGRRSGQPRYSNLAIVTALTLRMVFHQVGTKPAPGSSKRATPWKKWRALGDSNT